MAEPIDDGGPAFPVPPPVTLHNEVVVYADPGMSRRDFFAAKAMAAILSNSAATEIVSDDASRKGRRFGDYVAETAYLFADSMIAASKEPRHG